MGDAIKRSWWDKTKSAIIVIGAIFTMFGMFFAAFQFIDNTYAKDSQVIFLSHKVDVKILDDRINKLQNREWELEDRLTRLPPGDINIPAVKKQLRQAMAERDRLNEELQVVIQKYKQAEEDIKH